MTLINHIEKHLGKIDKGWKLKHKQSPIQVVRFIDQPFEGMTTYMSLGLSKHPLNLKQGKDIHQELIFSAHEKYPSEQIASFLVTFAEYLLSRKKALLRGDVVGPSTPLIPGVPVNSVYSSIPVFFDDSFYVYKGHQLPTVFVWLIPLLEDECKFIKQDGWNSFEDMLESKNPDLLDLDRSSIFSEQSL